MRYAESVRGPRPVPMDGARSAVVDQLIVNGADAATSYGVVVFLFELDDVLAALDPRRPGRVDVARRLGERGHRERDGHGLSTGRRRASPG